MIPVAILLLVTACIGWNLFFSALFSDYTSKKGDLILGSFVTSVLLTVAGLFLLGPWIQPFMFHVFFNAIGWWLIVALILAVASLAGFAARSAGIGLALFGVGFVSWNIIVWGIFGDAWTKQTVYDSLRYEQLESLPDTTALRYLPLEVAYRYGDNRLQDPGIGLGDAEPIVVGDEVQWLLPRVPKGFWNAWLRNADGFAIVDNSGNVSMVRETMKYGEGMLGADHILWKLREQRYFSNISEIYYVHGPRGEAVAVAPYLSYRFQFPVMVPYWGGVFLVYGSGRIEDLTPEQAMRHPLLESVRIFPEKLARLYVEAYAYKRGIMNALFEHKDQIEIPSVRSVDRLYGNEMPFLLPTALGQKWFVAAVPWGAEGIYRIFFVDAMDGRVEFFELPQDSALIGPKRAQGYIRGAYPYFDWNTMRILEPRPVLRSETLYWMFTITPSDFSGVADTVLVNARTSAVMSFGADKNELLAFVRGNNTGRVVTVGDAPSLQPVVSPSLPMPASSASDAELRELINDLRSLRDELRREIAELRAVRQAFSGTR